MPIFKNVGYELHDVRCFTRADFCFRNSGVTLAKEASKLKES